MAKAIPVLQRQPSRWLSALEFMLGTAVVLGHNVFHKVPNEVPILFVVGLVSLHWRDGRNGIGA